VENLKAASDPDYHITGFGAALMFNQRVIRAIMLE
jgi:hypothetical protein